ncbi:MAG: 4-(cytidine 5'-diphospho)-2-C-methyl-D-erythritol kinase, partial [Gammaproteobacteria bacterium]|nr:4-(cytidine 5'-diphospho)-2-C-methyl-D-erythritol kinase [Gammaproteobacteria bacterium]
MNKIQINSPAKINLFLKVKEKNQDGYHNIDTSFQLIDLFDRMSFETSDNGIVIKSNESFLENKNNTIYRSAKLLLKFIDGEMGVNIKIEKSIPIGAGLGGGSSNAASTLIALNKLWNLELSKDKLIKIAKKIGADVPF